MPAATSSTLGTILLAGDLAGSTDANSPALTPVGVTPGVYSNIGSLVVDSKGRIIDVGPTISLSIDDFPCADGATCGVVKIGQNINVSGDQISVSNATSSIAGVVKVGSGFNISGDCVVNVDYPISTSSSLGTVIIPTSGNLVVDGSGNISVPKATNTTLGGVKQGSNVSISDGALSISGYPISTSSSLGTVIVPTSGNLSVDGSGNLSVPPATNTVYGLVKSGNTSNITISSGDIDVPASKLTTLTKTTTNNVWTKSQNQVTNSITPTTNIVFDLSQGNYITILLSTNINILPPINPQPGAIYYCIITQSSTTEFGVSWDPIYKIKYMNNLSIGSSLNKKIIIQIICESTTSLLCIGELYN